MRKSGSKQQEFTLTAGVAYWVNPASGREKRVSQLPLMREFTG